MTRLGIAILTLFLATVVLAACGAPVEDEDDVGLTTTTCTMAGESCVLPPGEAVADAGDFWCLRTTGNDEARCAPACQRTFSVSECDEGQLCVRTSGEASVNICQPAACTSWRDDTACDGTCIEAADGVGWCTATGDVAEGAPCDDDARCGRAAVCDQDGGSAVCRPLCDWWSDDPACPTGQACAWLTDGQGVCRPALGGDVFEPCGTAGAWCNDGLRCLPFQSAGVEQLLCAPYCRRDSADCSSVTLDGLPTVCDWNAFADTVETGLCLPGCSDGADCRSGEACVSGVCAQPCESDTDCDADMLCFGDVCKPAG